MKLSTRCRYGVRALIEIARHYTEGPTKRKDIARVQGLSTGYLESILGALRSAGIVHAIRGADGGFALQKSPDQISLLEIVIALEGSIAPVECIEHPQECTKSSRCGARKAWMILYEAEKKALGSLSLKDLVEMDIPADALNYVI